MMAYDNNDGPIYSMVAGKACAGSCSLVGYQDGGGGWDAITDTCEGTCECDFPTSNGYDGETRTVGCITTV
jgi:hypothetical protein